MYTVIIIQEKKRIKTNERSLRERKKKTWEKGNEGKWREVRGFK